MSGQERENTVRARHEGQLIAAPHWVEALRARCGTQPGELLFLIGLAINLIYAGLLTTTFIGVLSESFFEILRDCSYLVLFLKLLIFDSRWTLHSLAHLKESAANRLALLYVGFALLCVLVFMFSGYTAIVDICLLVLAARGMRFKNAVKLYLVIIGVILVAAAACSSLGLIPNPEFYIWRADWTPLYERRSFGIIYPTDFASHVFFWFAGLLYLLRPKARLVCCAVLAVAAVGIYFLSRTRLDSACMLIAAVLIAYVTARVLFAERKGRAYRPARVTRIIALCFLPLCAVVFIGITVLYPQDIGLIDFLDGLLSRRLEFGWQGIEDYGFTVFGQDVVMWGGGYNPKPVEGAYFFIDCSYLNTLLCYGAVFFVLACALWVRMAHRADKTHDYNLLVILVVIALNCMVAHHWMEIAYNPFILAFFATLISEETHS